MTSIVSDARAEAEAQFAAAQAKLNLLASLNPVLLDVSLREPCFSSYLGHTLQNKKDLLPLVTRFGIPDKVIATLDFQDPVWPQVENDFCEYLQSINYDMTGCFALTAVGSINAAGAFVADQSMEKLKLYGIPNTMNEIYLLGDASSDHLQVKQRIAQSVLWLRQNIVGDGGGPTRIYINVVDLIDAFFADRDWCCEVLQLLSELQVDAVSFEDDRGTFFPFQVAAMVKAMKAYLQPKQLVLFHCHSGNGMENASVMDALLAGADGYWAGLEKESSTIGHASMGELVANLARAGNQTVTQRYRVNELLPICRAMHEINSGEADEPQTWPIQGSNAYRQMLTDFDQTPGRAMDLPPEVIGGTYTFRISPVGSDAKVIQGRVLELLGEQIDEDLATRMILRMRQQLREGTRTRYDDAVPLQELVNSTRLLTATATNDR